MKSANGTKEQNEGMNSTNATERINAIKTLIFGENMEEYDHKFHDLFDKLEEFHDELEDKINKLHKKMTADFASLKQKFDEDLNTLKQNHDEELKRLNDAKTNRHDLSDMLKDVAAKLSK